MADEVCLSGLQLPGDPTLPLEPATMQYVDHRTLGVLGDQWLYGDLWSTMARREAATQRAVTLGRIDLWAEPAGDTFTATKLRFGVAVAAAGTGTVNAGVYTGSTSTAMTRAAAIPQQTTLPTGLREYTLSTGVPITPGLHVCIALLVTGFSTLPQIAGQTGAPISAIINSTAGRNIAATGTTTGQTTLPTTLNMTSGYAGSGVAWWFALAA